MSALRFYDVREVVREARGGRVMIHGVFGTREDGGCSWQQDRSNMTGFFEYISMFRLASSLGRVHEGMAL